MDADTEMEVEPCLEATREDISEAGTDCQMCSSNSGDSGDSDVCVAGMCAGSCLAKRTVLALAPLAVKSCIGDSAKAHTRLQLEVTLSRAGGRVPAAGSSNDCATPDR